MPKNTAKTSKTPTPSTASSVASTTTAKQTKSKKASPQPVESVAPVSSVTTEPSVVVSTTESVVTESVEQLGFEQAFKEVTNSLNSQLTNLKSVLADVRKLEKRVQKELREAKKGRRRRKAQEGGEKTKRAPSGFAKPSQLSNELCGFLGVETGTFMARTEVTKHITKYIRDHELQDPSYKRRILCDKPLGELLKVGDNQEVTYFNLQSFMKDHFPKKSGDGASTVSSN